MKFDDLDKMMRTFETANDYCVLPELYMIARIDGRSFTRLTKNVHQFERPFDIKFRDYMVGTVRHLMKCGFKVLYGYTQSDEISLLFHRDENLFQRKLRKFNSILSGEASAKFSLLLGDIGAFDCRISQLPTEKLVVDYFSWRQADAHRNALNAHCYWLLRRQGKQPNEAHNAICHISTAEKNELLFSHGINFNELPAWQKRGTGIYWKNIEKAGFNPIKKQTEITTRQQLFNHFELPMKEDYQKFIQRFLHKTT